MIPETGSRPPDRDAIYERLSDAAIADVVRKVKLIAQCPVAEIGDACRQAALLAEMARRIDDASRPAKATMRGELCDVEKAAMVLDKAMRRLSPATQRLVEMRAWIGWDGSGGVLLPDGSIGGVPPSFSNWEQVREGLGGVRELVVSVKASLGEPDSSRRSQIPDRLAAETFALHLTPVYQKLFGREATVSETRLGTFGYGHWGDFFTLLLQTLNDSDVPIPDLVRVLEGARNAQREGGTISF